MKKRIGQYLYDIGDVYSLLQDAIDGISASHIIGITDVAVDYFLRWRFEPLFGIEPLYELLKAHATEEQIADLVSELIEWFDTSVGYHLTTVSPKDCVYSYHVSRQTELIVTLYTPIPTVVSEVSKIKQLIQHDLDNGDYYPEAIRHALKLL